MKRNRSTPALSCLAARSKPALNLGSTRSAMSPMLAAALARSLQVPQRAPQRIDFVLVGIGLTFEGFNRFQHLFHILEGIAQGRDHLVDLFDGLLDARRRGRLPWPLWSWGSPCRRRLRFGGGLLRRRGFNRFGGPLGVLKRRCRFLLDISRFGFRG
jgi:hypothetical protein